MYYVAIVSSENEMHRYAWADVRPMLKNEHFKDNYIFEMFSSHNISDLFYNLKTKNKYDSIIFTSNSCNEPTILAVLRSDEAKALLKKVIDDGKGIFISLQMHIAVESGYTGFLPTEFDFKSVKRGKTEEKVANFNYNKNHLITNLTEEISLDNINYHCMNNQFVASYYIAHLIPNIKDQYEPIIFDEDYGFERPVLMCSQGVNNRIVISTMVLDWQEHTSLFCNIVKFVTEGPPIVALFYKNCSQSAYFNYLKEVMWYKKISFQEYNICDSLSTCVYGYSIGSQRQGTPHPSCDTTVRLINEFKILVDRHSIYITDPSWTETENRVLWDKIKTSTRITYLFFFSEIASKKTIIEFENYSQVEQITSNVCTWLHSRFDDVVGRWQKSFWATCDVIDLFFALGLSAEEYRDSIIRGLEKNIHDHSYDYVVSATCGLLKMYMHLFGKNDQHYINTRNWIKNKIEKASLFEIIAILSTFRELGESLENEITLISDINVKLDECLYSGRDNENEINILRNCKFYVFTEDYDRLKQWLVLLIRLQNTSGEWINVSRTGLIASFLLRERRTFIEKRIYHDENLKDLDYNIFNAISYLYATYDKKNCNWNSDVPSTAVAVLALHEFDKIINYPIDKIVEKISGNKEVLAEEGIRTPILESLLVVRKALSEQKNVTAEEHRTNDVLTACNKELTDKSNLLQSNILQLEKKIEKYSVKIKNEKRKHQKIKTIWLYVSSISILIGFFSVWLSVYIFENLSEILGQVQLQPKSYLKILWDFAKGNIFTVIALIFSTAIIPFIVNVASERYSNNKENEDEDD